MNGALLQTYVTKCQMGLAQCDFFGTEAQEKFNWNKQQGDKIDKSVRYQMAFIITTRPVWRRLKW